MEQWSVSFDWGIRSVWFNTTGVLDLALPKGPKGSVSLGRSWRACSHLPFLAPPSISTVSRLFDRYWGTLIFLFLHIYTRSRQSILQPVTLLPTSSTIPFIIKPVAYQNSPGWAATAKIALGNILISGSYMTTIDDLFQPPEMDVYLRLKLVLEYSNRT